MEIGERESAFVYLVLEQQSLQVLILTIFHKSISHKGCCDNLIVGNVFVGRGSVPFGCNCIDKRGRYLDGYKSNLRVFKFSESIQSGEITETIIVCVSFSC